MDTVIEHVKSYVVHIMKIPEEDVEAKLLIPGGWSSNSNEYLIIVIRHGNYITVCKSVENEIGRSIVNIADSFYPNEKDIPKLYKLVQPRVRDAREVFPVIIDILTDKTFTNSVDIRRAIKWHRNAGYVKECQSAFADLSMDFAILGPILEYCDKAILTFKRVTGEVKLDGSSNTGTNENPSGDWTSVGDVDQDRPKD